MAQSPSLPLPANVDAQLTALAGRRVAVALSGGVDSAVAGLRLKQAGAEVVGLALRLHDPEPDNPLAPRACCAPDDLQDARRVAEALEIPFYVLDAREAFDQRVVQPFVDAYLSGRTPNPCVGCNSFVKLERLDARARALGCVALATGHYARLAHDPTGAPHLYAGADADKDQSYFLFGVPPSILSRLVFPLGAMTKPEVREVALSSGLPVAHKLESQEVCFVGGAGAGAFVRRRPEAEGDHRGPILDAEGRVLGEHEGVMNYTIGQRKGLGVAAAHPLHVLSIDAERKAVTVGAAELLSQRALRASRASWPAGVPPGPIRAEARIRYRGRAVPAQITPGPGDRVEVRFEAPMRAIAPGQAVVFSRGPEILGGAFIDEALLD